MGKRATRRKIVESKALKYASDEVFELKQDLKRAYKINDYAAVLRIQERLGGLR